MHITTPKVGLWLMLGICAEVLGLERHNAVSQMAFTLSPTPFPRTRVAARGPCSSVGSTLSYPRRIFPRTVQGFANGLKMQMDFGQSLFNLERLASAGVSAELQHVTPTSAILIFAAGVLTSLSPCALSVLPFTVGYIGGIADGKRSSFPPSLAFAMGLATSLCGLGLAASLLGKVYGTEGSGLAAGGPVLSAGLYILLGLALLDIIQLPSLLPSASSLAPEQRSPSDISTSKSPGYAFGELFRAFAFGASSALVASPCATPVLASLLAFISSNKVDPSGGAALLFAYSTGYTVPILAAGVAAGGLKSLLSLKSYFRWITPASGAILIAYGTYSALDHLVPV